MKFSFFLAMTLTFALFQPHAKAERVRLLQDNKDALQARVDLVQHAKNEVLAEYFSVWNDNESVGALSLLLRAAQNGGKVKIIMDSLSNTVPPQLFAALLEQGQDSEGHQNLEIKVYNSFNILHPSRIIHRDHAKMLIVDGDRLITGGRNVGDKYFGLNAVRNFRDLDILTEGTVAKEARESFMDVWNSKLVSLPAYKEFSADERFDIYKCPAHDQGEYFGTCETLRRKAIKLVNDEIERIRRTLSDLFTHTENIHVDVGSQKDWLEGIEDSPKVLFLSHQEDRLVSEKTAEMSRRLKELALHAKKEINILSPYLVPTAGMIKVFQDLLDHKVRVRIITNSLTSTDNLLAQAGYRQSKDQLIKMGIELYEYKGPDTTHAKVAVIDGEVSIIGTYNLDPRSAGINREVGVAIMDTPNDQLAKNLTNVIEEFRANTILVGKDGVPQNLDLQKEQESKVGSRKMMTLKTLIKLLPFFRNQI